MNTVISHGTYRHASARFGAKQYENPYQDKNKAQQAAKDILAFEAPNPVEAVQQTVLFLNRVISLPRFKVTPVISKADIALLRGIPKEAGNMLVGPHPDSPDGNLMTNMFR